MQLQLFVEEITRLHTEIEAYLNKSLANALEIGAKLDQVKADLPHGEFTGWVEDNLPFTPRTARNYMKLYENRDKLESNSVSSIGEAYKLLRNSFEAGKTETVSVFGLTDEEKLLLERCEMIIEKGLKVIQEHGISLDELNDYFENYLKDQLSDISVYEAILANGEKLEKEFGIKGLANLPSDLDNLQRLYQERYLRVKRYFKKVS